MAVRISSHMRRTPRFCGKSCNFFFWLYRAQSTNSVNARVRSVYLTSSTYSPYSSLELGNKGTMASQSTGSICTTTQAH